MTEKERWGEERDEEGREIEAKRTNKNALCWFVLSRGWSTDLFSFFFPFLFFFLFSLSFFSFPFFFLYKQRSQETLGLGRAVEPPRPPPRMLHSDRGLTKAKRIQVKAQ